MKVTRKKVFSIPNILSYIRILLIPVIIYLFLHATERTDYYVVGSLILLSGLTDLLDGLLESLIKLQKSERNETRRKVF